MRTLDDVDLLILHELQCDGRLSNQDLADRVGLSPSPCLRRVRRLESEGVIARYTAVVDPTRIGLDITAFVRLKLSRHGAQVPDEVEAAIRAVPEVNEAYLLAGDFDYLLKVTTSSFARYEQLLREELRQIPALASIETAFTINITKIPSPLVVG